MLLPVLLLLFARPPEELLAQAKANLHKPDQRARAISLLREANGEWKAQNSSSPAYAESLDLFANLERTELPGEAREAAHSAVAIREMHPEDRGALALAYEIEADAIGRPGPDADPLWQKGFAIRQERVAALSVTSGPVDAKAVGNGTTPPVLTAKEEPQYSPAAASRKLQGAVLLKILISAEGVPIQFQLLRGLGYGLDESAALAVSRWRFKPALHGGEPVAVRAQIAVNFRILPIGPGV